MTESSGITVVSGLPRSGTSLMMQMLAVGGMAVVTDGQRLADEDNPRGYFEWERVKLLPRQPELIAEAEGKAVKVISQLLFSLPAGRDYRIVFMERPLAEVVASQAEMIRRRGSAAPAVTPAILLQALQAHLNQVNVWLKQRPSASLCRIDYRQLIADPGGASRAIQQFVQAALDVAAMERQVDSSLYRHRSG
jgi:hypothetical protein